MDLHARLAHVARDLREIAAAPLERIEEVETDSRIPRSEPGRRLFRSVEGRGDVR
jgi:hypothetical protein